MPLELPNAISLNSGAHNFAVIDLVSQPQSLEPEVPVSAQVAVKSIVSLVRDIHKASVSLKSVRSRHLTDPAKKRNSK